MPETTIVTEDLKYADVATDGSPPKKLGKIAIPWFLLADFNFF